MTIPTTGGVDGSIRSREGRGEVGQSSRYLCHRCGQVLAVRRGAVMGFRVPVSAVRHGKARCSCGCGKVTWVRLPEGTAKPT